MNFAFNVRSYPVAAEIVGRVCSSCIIRDGQLQGKVCHFSRPETVNATVGNTALEWVGSKMAELLMKSANLVWFG